ncbi:cyclin-dependent kinase inhibitor 1 isoform X1 [Takifugu flavidus]|uniref:cyclin-dependent kinase inhibitor 1 isoform X1 n=1 Tax=Takifugu flavidus TaxID=433684 RepID=UPI0025446539|nr:cyclin-dependent kinase inhibitor 1 isoform X1 [Takifugu flavidus]
MFTSYNLKRNTYNFIRQKATLFPDLTANCCRIMASHKRILGTLGNGPVRRNLFGPVDRDQLQVEYRAALRKDLEDASNRWGFDFISDKPMENSDFLWEGIPGSKVPLLYRSSTPTPPQPQRAAEPKVSRVSASSNGKENIPCSPETCPLDMGSLEKTPEKRESTGLKRKQTNITDFYQAKRRVVGMPRKSGE